MLLYKLFIKTINYGYISNFLSNRDINIDDDMIQNSYDKYDYLKLTVSLFCDFC